MRLLALAALLPLFALADGHASVTVSDHEHLSFEDGHAYFMAFDGFGVMALATAPLSGGTWAHGDSAFTYVEVRVFEGIHEGEIALGGGANLTVQHWPAAGTEADGPSFFTESGTLTFTEVSDSLAVGTISAELLGYADDGTESRAALEASFRALPGNIRAP